MESRLREEAQNACNALKQRFSQIKSDFNAAKNEILRKHKHELSNVRSSHEAQLDSLDSKVRSALTSKDELIASLREQLRTLETKNQASEKTLRELHAEISSIRR